FHQDARDGMVQRRAAASWRARVSPRRGEARTDPVPPARATTGGARPRSLAGGDSGDPQHESPEPRAVVRRGDDPVLRWRIPRTSAGDADRGRADGENDSYLRRLHHSRRRGVPGVSEPESALLPAEHLSILARDLVGASPVTLRLRPGGLRDLVS